MNDETIQSSQGFQGARFLACYHLKLLGLQWGFDVVCVLARGAVHLSKYPVAMIEYY